MPFKKVGKNKYKSPSGKIYTKKQVRAYYATGGWSRPVKKNNPGDSSKPKGKVSVKYKYRKKKGNIVPFNK